MIPMCTRSPFHVRVRAPADAVAREPGSQPSQQASSTQTYVVANGMSVVGYCSEALGRRS